MTLHANIIVQAHNLELFQNLSSKILLFISLCPSVCPLSSCLHYLWTLLTILEGSSTLAQHHVPFGPAMMEKPGGDHIMTAV